MKKIFGVLFLNLIIVQFATAQQAEANQIEKLSWLKGTWERLDTRAGESAFEQWWEESSKLTGEGVTLRGTDTVFVEKLSIVVRDRELYYTADVSHNTEPTYFKITQLSSSGFVCENPNHDFPKKIEYKREENGNMEATISGNGQSMTFMFRKLPDNPDQVE